MEREQCNVLIVHDCMHIALYSSCTGYVLVSSIIGPSTIHASCAFASDLLKRYNFINSPGLLIEPGHISFGAKAIKHCHMQYVCPFTSPGPRFCIAVGCCKYCIIPAIPQNMMLYNFTFVIKSREGGLKYFSKHP